MWKELGIAFQIMGQGMLGIFATIIFIILVVTIMKKIL